MAACSLSLTSVHDPQIPARMKRYHAIASRYSKEEGFELARLLEITAETLTVQPDEDLLGRIYMDLNINQKSFGQYFTPPPSVA